ncbi:hypothetical protein GTA28_27425 [Rhodococcus hoagii]|nr:hypothetical protein [Prescottella equi]
MSGLEAKPHDSAVATQIAESVGIVTKKTDISGDARLEWHAALDAADRALTALREATAHRNAVSTVDDRPAPDASVHTIRDWVLDARRILAREASRVVSTVGQSATDGYFQRPAALASDLHAIADRITALHEANRSSGQRGGSWALPSNTSAAVPVWTGRRAWLAQVQHALSTENGRATCASRHTSPDVVLRHAAVYAIHADGRTGRGVTVSRATIIAETAMSETADKRSRRVLRSLELLVDGAVGRTLTTGEHLAASLHHGSSQSRAASTLHLTTPPYLAHIQAPSPTRRKRASQRVSAARTTCTGRDPYQ